jgi:hypothetical protein
MAIKGLRDIPTSTGKNGSRRGGARGIVPRVSIGLGNCSARRGVAPQRETASDDWGGDVSRHQVKVGKSLPLPKDNGNFQRKIDLLYIIRLHSDIDECRQFCEDPEKIPGVRRMLRKLEAELAALEKEAK